MQRKLNVSGQSEQWRSVMVYLLGGCIHSYCAVISTKEELSAWYAWHNLEHEVQISVLRRQKPKTHPSGLAVAFSRVWGKGKNNKTLSTLVKNMFWVEAEPSRHTKLSAPSSPFLLQLWEEHRTTACLQLLPPSIWGAEDMVMLGEGRWWLGGSQALPQTCCGAVVLVYDSVRWGFGVMEKRCKLEGEVCAWGLLQWQMMVLNKLTWDLERAEPC